MFCLILLTICCGASSFVVAAEQRYKVLVVFSYEEDFPWDVEVREGIESVLGNQADLHYFYMNTKTALDSGPKEAAAAFALYQRLQPDGVIVSDDNAQSMFVVPYLKDRVKTPVMFCGVNAAPEKYGYPASNVSGILERQPVNEAVALARQLVPSIQKIGFMMKDSPTAKAIEKEIRAVGDNGSAVFVAYKLPSSQKELLSMAKELREMTDAIYMVNFSGIVDEQGRKLKDDEVVPKLAKVYGKPLISGSSYNVRLDGVLAAVAKTGQEQGRTASRMLLRVLQGEPIIQVPITRNYRGKRIINVSTLRKLSITPPAIVLRGAKLVRTPGEIEE